MCYEKRSYHLLSTQLAASLQAGSNSAKILRMSRDELSDRHGGNIVAWAFTGLVPAGLIILLGPSFLPGMTPIPRGLAKLYFFLMEAMFFYVESNVGILFVSALCLALALGLWAARRAGAGSGGRHRRFVMEAAWNFLCVLALIAQLYLIAFAFLSERIYFLIILILGLIAAFIAGRTPGRGREKSSEAPFLFLMFFLALYLFLGMVAGHLATRPVHWVAVKMAGLSTAGPIGFRALVSALLLLPLLVWLPRVGLSPKRAGYVFGLPLLAGFMVLAVPNALAPYFIGIPAAIALAAAARIGGVRIADWLHPLPRVLFSRLLVVSLLALNAVVVHYAVHLWRCDDRPDHPALRRISTSPGVFDLATNGDGTRLLASLREPRILLSIDLLTGKERNALDFNLVSTGRRFSWTEPETLLPLDDGRRFLLLVAVSDDENENRVVLIDEEGRVIETLSQLPEAGISDFVSDGAGRVYFSTEFESQIIVLDEKTFRVVDRILWPGAETNRIFVEASLGRIFSLGLWTDPLFRAWDLGEGRQVAALTVGTRSWDMAYDPVTQRLFIPRLLSGKVLVVDARSLKLLDEWPVGFGARPTAIDPARRLLYVGNMYDGCVTVFNVDDGRRVFRTCLGAYIKSLHVDAATHRAYTGGVCGIFSLDPDRFLESATK